MNLVYLDVVHSLSQPVWVHRISLDGQMQITLTRQMYRILHSQVVSSSETSDKPELFDCLVFYGLGNGEGCLSPPHCLVLRIRLRLR